MTGVALAIERLGALEKVTPEQERMVLGRLIQHGPAIEGITFKQEHSVNGVEFGDYMKVIERVKETAFE